jgi:hypothetical protein
MITTVRIRGIDLAYEDVGPTEDGALDGTPLVWGHGLSRSVAEDNEFPMIDWQRIRRTRRVVRFDARSRRVGPACLPRRRRAWDRSPRRGGLIEALSLPDVPAAPRCALQTASPRQPGDRQRGPC